MATQGLSDTPAWRARKARRWLAVRAGALSAAFGGLIWAVSPTAFGHPEPWDGNPTLYFQSLFLAGLVAALVVRGPFWAHYLGTIVGQSAFVLLVLPLGAFSGMAPFVIALYGALVAMGAALGSGARRLLHHFAGRA
ncbi:hypothetical protein [Lysobacter sp. N42]|uniref:hypothetical protein n=1 Tax=Lysobacter sp. N42 TaxID=2545719 RepID=UPI0010495973|nr:hypothetical protein [Lysobacter sp. N42]TCZ78097.1 hypothetical protein EYQ95_25775 [Lysobacter sp. N42]